MSLQVIQIPARRDNYVYVLHEQGSRQAAVVDPADAAPVFEVLAEHQLDLFWVLNTHHHHDHTGGNLVLQRTTGCRIAGPAREAARIPGLTDPLAPDEVFNGFATPATILDVGGHTLGQIAFFFRDDLKVFCGDALFAMGCGRLFEGDAKQAWDSLCRLRDLPDATQVYCAHEYTLANAGFALTVMPDDIALQARAKQVQTQRTQGVPTVPFLLGEEKATNPFLRADDPKIAEAVGMPGASAVAVFAELRRRKDFF